MMFCTGHSLRQDAVLHCSWPGYRPQHIAAPARCALEHLSCYLCTVASLILHGPMLTLCGSGRQKQHLQLRLSECTSMQVRSVHPQRCNKRLRNHT